MSERRHINPDGTKGPEVPKSARIGSGARSKAWSLLEDAQNAVRTGDAVGARVLTLTAIDQIDRLIELAS